MATSSKEGKESDQQKETCFYQEWMKLQEEEVSQLNKSVALYENGHTTETEPTRLIENTINNYREYLAKRSLAAQQDACPYFAPMWCTSLEKSALWIGGCRPSAYTRLIYSIGTQNIESQLADFLSGKTRDLGWLTGQQLSKVDELQRETIYNERVLSSRMAVLQQDFMDVPVPEDEDNAEEALDALSKEMARILVAADQLRLETLMKLVRALSPMQAVQFLAGGKKHHLCMHEWGRKMDLHHGRN